MGLVGCTRAGCPRPDLPSLRLVGMKKVTGDFGGSPVGVFVWCVGISRFRGVADGLSCRLAIVRSRAWL